MDDRLFSMDRPSLTKLQLQPIDTYHIELTSDQLVNATLNIN